MVILSIGRSLFSTEVKLLLHSIHMQIPFTLSPVGEESSRMSLHFPGLFFFGMTPNGLVWIVDCMSLPFLHRQATRGSYPYLLDAMYM